LSEEKRDEPKKDIQKENPEGAPLLESVLINGSLSGPDGGEYE
jgi:hypothetical protein